MANQGGKDDLILRGAGGELYRIPNEALDRFKVGDAERAELEKDLESKEVSGQQSHGCVTCYGPGCTSISQ